MLNSVLGRKVMKTPPPKEKNKTKKKTLTTGFERHTYIVTFKYKIKSFDINLFLKINKKCIK